jgi:hypothetical protein
MNDLVTKIASREIDASLERADRARRLGGLRPDQFLEQLHRSPMWQQELAARRAERRNEREALCARRDALPAQAAKELTALARDEKAAEAAAATARAALDRARAAAAAASIARRTREAGLTAAVGQLNLLLEASADPMLDEFIAGLEIELNELHADRPGRFEPYPSTRYFMARSLGGRTPPPEPTSDKKIREAIAHERAAKHAQLIAVVGKVGKAVDPEEINLPSDSDLRARIEAEQKSEHAQRSAHMEGLILATRLAAALKLTPIVDDDLRAALREIEMTIPYRNANAAFTDAQHFQHAAGRIGPQLSPAAAKQLA